jgi:hypothetical protein
MGDPCTQVSQIYVAKVTDIDNQNLKISAENKKAEEKYRSDMADYETQQRAVRKQDTGNVANCGTLPDASDVWTLDSWSVPCWACNFACSYKYTDIQIKRLMDNWKLKNPFIPKKQIKQPNPPNLQCCSNIINLAGSTMSKDALENIRQSCDQTINNNRGGNDTGGNGTGDNSSQNDDPNSQYNTDGTQTDNSSTKKIILGAIIGIILLVPVIIGIIIFFNNNNKIRKKIPVFHPPLKTG